MVKTKMFKEKKSGEIHSIVIASTSAGTAVPFSASIHFLANVI